MQAFIALSANDICNESLQTLTPRVMQWSEDTWIFDLSPCFSYWQAQAENLTIDVVSLIRKVLQQTFGSDSDNTSIGEAACYQASLAFSPWQAVFLLNYMKDRQIGGFVHRFSGFGNSLYHQASWEAWWQAAEEIAKHFVIAGRKRFKIDVFKSQRRRLQDAVKRLGAQLPSQLKQADHLSLKRRFGSTISELWQWTWQEEGKDDASVFAKDVTSLLGFPWQNWHNSLQPKVERLLEAPLIEWEYIEPFLKEDFDRLCHLDSWDSQERVVSLEWHVVSSDMTSHIIPIHFRHPHCLHDERNCHRTAALQAMYAFEQTVAKTKGDYIDTDLYFSPIISWTLEVTERIVIPPRILDLFGEGSNECNQLNQLENRLAIKLAAFDMMNSWDPENSYRPYHFDKKRFDQYDNMSFRSLRETARERPLFIYDRPVHLTEQQGSTLRIFLERTMSRWWTHSNQRSWQRDYYKLMNKDHRCFWVYRNDKGEWFLHGIFA